MTVRPDTEKRFEDAVVEALLAHGWELGKPENYVPELGLDKTDLEFFVRHTQFDEWERLWEIYGEYPTVPFRNLVAREIDDAGRSRRPAPRCEGPRHQDQAGIFPTRPHPSGRGAGPVRG